jgi:ribonuclease HI
MKRRKSHYLVEVLGRMRVNELRNLEMKDPRPLAPWVNTTFESIEIAQDKEQAARQLERALEDPSHVAYTDASARDSGLGAAAVILNHRHEVVQSTKMSVGRAQQWTIHTAELIAIRCALRMVAQQRLQIAEQSRSTSFTIVSDSKSALQALAKPSNRSGQHIVYDIISITAELRRRNIGIRLLWTPGHHGTPGNEKADELAREAVGAHQDHPFHHLLSARKKQNKQSMMLEWRDEWQTSTKGIHLRKIDNDLPSNRTLRLYGKLSRPRARLLVQLRTGHNWLASFAKLFKFKEEDKCECGTRETVVHVLIDCPLLRELRQQMREQVGYAFRQLSTLLGGGDNGKRGMGKVSADKKVLIAVLDFAERSERFRPRDTVENFTRRRQKTTHRP